MMTMATVISPRLAKALHEPRPRLFTVEEFNQLGTAGLFEGQRVELIEGEIILMSPQGPNHSSVVELVAEAFRQSLGKGYWVRTQAPLPVSNLSEPEPDIAIIAGSPRTVRQHPKVALLVVEVSDSTRAFDRGRKAALYAKSGISDYWVVDLVQDCVVVHRQPMKGLYTEVAEFRRGQKVAPLAWPKRKIKIDDLLL
jgi:Uma2 family endonuclease